MQRQIKFRVWDGKRWITHFGLEDYSSMSCTLNELFNNSPKEFIFQQFTALKDKNGREIYEGDILCLHDNPPPYTAGNSIVEVIYNSSAFCYKKDKKIGTIYGDIGQSTMDEIAEVIGNIFENPDLLK